jgi:hypothetical protein
MNYASNNRPWYGRNLVIGGNAAECDPVPKTVEQRVLLVRAAVGQNGWNSSEQDLHVQRD